MGRSLINRRHDDLDTPISRKVLLIVVADAGKKQGRRWEFGPHLASAVLDGIAGPSHRTIAAQPGREPGIGQQLVDQLGLTAEPIIDPRQGRRAT
jgi:hypothetical protein